ncbi:uncharacterized protein [Eleutherodactylus coqui]|uniref:uncharacterized protein isoform X1 n=1 Tax=Eleutherodactylus coqui TaxID=57060 RepID=UPI003461BA26
MDSRVSVLELQNDCSVKQHEVPLTFPRGSKSRLYVVTNQNTQLHLLNILGGNPRTEEGGGAVQEKSIFQHGVSTKVFAIMDATGTEWEIRVLLSPSEISRLSSSFNLTGFVSVCLTDEKYQDSLQSLCGPHPKHKANVQELCMTAAQFLSYSEENLVNDYCKELNRILTEKVGAAFIGQQKLDCMVVGALVALVAAELATSVGSTSSFDYKAEKEKTQDDQTKQIQEMIEVFDVMADLLTVSHQGKRVQIIFRNPCPDNWASGGKKLVKSGETFVFGLCHKVLSISESKSEIQFLQNLQESYDLVLVFHLAAFMEHLLMTSTSRNKIEIFLKEQDQRKEIIRDLSFLAVRFICSKTCHQKAFLKEFQDEMLKKWSSVEAFLVGDEAVCSFGILVAILAAIIVKSIVDRCICDAEEDNSEEPADTFTSAAPETNVSRSSGTFLGDSLSCNVEIVTNINDEYGGTQSDLCISPGNWVKVELDIGEMGTAGAESKIGSTNGSPKTGKHLAEPPGVTRLDSADQEMGYNDTHENLDKYRSTKNNAHASAPTSAEANGGSHGPDGGDGTSLDYSKDDRACRIGQPLSLGAQENAHESSPTSPDAEEAHHHLGSNAGPSLDDSSDNRACRVAQPRSLEAQENAHESSPASPDAEEVHHHLGSNAGPSLDDSSDNRACRVAQPRSLGAQENAHESSPISPDAEEAHHHHLGSNAGPSLYDSSVDGACRVAPPPIVGAQDNPLEQGDSSSRNTIFHTLFIGLVFLLAFVMLTKVLPQSMISILFAIILGLLLIKWLVNWQA